MYDNQILANLFLQQKEVHHLMIMPVTINFGNVLDNKNSKVWIRIFTPSATTGSGSRASTAIDDVQIKWK